MFCSAKPPAKQSGLTRSGSVEGQAVSNILIDTGCSQSIVREELVPQERLLGEAVTIRCAHGDVVLYPLAMVEIQMDNRTMELQVAVSDTLPVDVLLGTDAPGFATILDGASSIQETKEAMVVTTRSRKQQKQEEDEQSRDRERDCGVSPHRLLEADGQPKSGDKGHDNQPINSERQETPFFQFHDELFTPGGQSRTRLTKRQKRAAKRDFVHSQEHVRHALYLDQAELHKLQEEDESLKTAWEAAKGTPNSVGPGFFIRDGILFRRTDNSDHLEQIAVPMTCRQDILRIAHEVPLAVHLGRNKTAKRILQRFYWPTLFRDVRDFCKSCAKCQKAIGRKEPCVPLIPLPVMSVPFQRIAMDIVGPLPKSRKGNRYILVVCDYATRYPEAIPLRSIEAETITDELVKLFSRVGIPQDILTDQGSNFTSKLLQELYKLLHIHPIRTSPYHPQTDGLVERFNQTLKAMLRKCAMDEGKDWDKLLPYLLFAYREVPQDSTGFSPFELLYGRCVRGPLDVLKESWVASERGDQSVVSHILDIRDKLAKLHDIVKENLCSSQQQQKHWYDKSARHREFQQGEHVLVLLPTANNKLLAQWQGPYIVKEKVGKVNYQVEMHDRRKKYRVFHVNMLKKWHTPVRQAYWTAEDSPDIDSDDDVPVWHSNQPTSNSKVTMGD